MGYGRCCFRCQATGIRGRYPGGGVGGIFLPLASACLPVTAGNTNNTLPTRKKKDGWVLLLQQLNGWMAPVPIKGSAHQIGGYG